MEAAEEELMDGAAAKAAEKSNIYQEGVLLVKERS
jgi:hypothetical protein